MSYTEKFQVNSASIPDLFDSTLSAIDEIGWKITGGNSTGTLVIAKTGFSFRSSGETVNVTFREVDCGAEVEVRSTCSWQLSSWGKNAENVARLHESIERHLMLATDNNVSGLTEDREETSQQRDASKRLLRKYCCNCGAALESATSAEEPKSNTEGMKCSICGEMVSAEAKFCSFCGARRTQAFSPTK